MEITVDQLVNAFHAGEITFGYAAQDAPEVAWRAIVTRLARRGRSGDSVIERAAIMAEGPDSGAIIRWILDAAKRTEPSAPSAPPPADSVDQHVANRLYRELVDP